MVEAQLIELATAVQSVQAQLMASEAARSNLEARKWRDWDELLVNGRWVSCLSQLRCTGASGTEGRDAASGETVNCRNQCGTYRN